MKKIPHHLYLKSIVWFLGAGFFIVSVVAGSMLGPWSLDHKKPRNVVEELERLDLLSKIPNNVLDDLIDYQSQSGRSLAQILAEPYWRKRLGFAADSFKSTWYMSNPYELLPSDLQSAIRKRPTPFASSSHLWEWCRENQAPQAWKEALNQALIETTATNLWRAGQGQRSYATNGEFIEPIVIDHGSGRLEVRDGHIATDPRVIPTNSTVYLLVKIDGEERILKVKAADTGCAIKGKHVDLPIHLSTQNKILPKTLFPKAVSNPSVTILTIIPVLAKPVSPNQPAESVSL